MFSAVMAETGSWFVVEPPRASGGQSAAAAEEAVQSPVVRKCRWLQEQLLAEKDPQLSAYLEALGIEPQLYALRWLRLLLGREFHLEDTLLLWDAMFAYGQRLALLDHLIVAMLVYVRDELLSRDYSDCMRRLFRYPPLEDVLVLVRLALKLMYDPSSSSSSSSLVCLMRRGAGNHPSPRRRRLPRPTSHPPRRAWPPATRIAPDPPRTRSPALLLVSSGLVSPPSEQRRRGNGSSSAGSSGATAPASTRSQIINILKPVFEDPIVRPPPLLSRVVCACTCVCAGGRAGV
jgi:hypothetical protein